LCEDVVVFPVAQLSEERRRQLDGCAGSFIVTRPASRARSRVVEAKAAELIERFRRPVTVVDAILEVSQRSGSDPRHVLEQAFPLVQDLLRAGWLVEEALRAREIEARFRASERVGRWTVVRCLQVLEDTEIYFLADDSGTSAALKLCRSDRAPATAAAFGREAQILERLRGEVAPALMEGGCEDGLEYVVLEWVAGEPASRVASKLRRRGQGRPTELLDLAVRIADAYARLHGVGVVHGDVHGRNVLVAESGAVRVLDYGLARVPGDPGELSKASRGGFSEYYEPEYAAARLEGRKRPQASFLGEQYALGALLYSLFTGRDYVRFSLDRDAQLAEIVDREPLTFEANGAPAWPELEACLRKALAKRSEERFAGVAELAAELRALPSAETPADIHVLDSTTAPRLPMRVDRASQDLRRSVLSRLSRLEMPSLATLPEPRCSLTFGGAGIAYALYRLACLEDDAELLSIADLWANASFRASADPGAFESERLGVTRAETGEASLFHSPLGLHLVQALISRAMADEVSVNEAVRMYLLAAEPQHERLDVSFGRAGVLLGCAALREACGPRRGLEELGARLLRELWDELAGLPRIAEDLSVRFLGVAHGWAGLIHATLRWCAASGADVPQGLRSRLDELASCADMGAGPSVSRVRWPRLAPAAVGGKQLHSGWCNGSAGHAQLWTAAHARFGDEEHLRLAEGAALDAARHEDATVSLCCGLTGRAYALLTLHRHTGELRWLDEARRVAARALDAVSTPGSFSHSLWKGELGLVLLGAELETPDRSAMPVLESESSPARMGWGSENRPRSEPLLHTAGARRA
jgi:serine/threonine-protein kinase